MIQQMKFNKLIFENWFDEWRYRITASSLGFHPRNLGSTPSSAAKRCVNCNLTKQIHDYECVGFDFLTIK